MARFRKPFFRPARGVWYVWHGGKQVNLGPERDAAFTAWHELRSKPALPTALAPAEAQRLVVVIVDEFLDWCEKHRAPDTYRWYKDRLESFCKTIEPALTVDRLKPHHVQKWVDNYGVPLAPGSRRNLIASVKRAMKWAEEQGYVERSPLAHMKKPGCGRKEQVVTPAEFEALLARYKDQEFRDLLTVTWETGCRPQESLRVEARHVDGAGGRWVFPASESKGKKTPRVVHPRLGIDPKTGKKPRNEAARNRLQNHLNEEPDRLRHAYTAMLDTYLDGFGNEAAQALDKAIRAWHAGIPVEIKRAAPDHIRDATKMVAARPRPSSILPVPMPLPEAAAAGRFGYEQDGKPVKPGPHEVRAITENHAEKIIDLMETVAALEKRPRMPQADEAKAKLKEALDAYAEDFGQGATDWLERYARRQCGRSR